MVHVLGAGSLGRLFASRIASAGSSVTLLVRPESPLVGRLAPVPTRHAWRASVLGHSDGPELEAPTVAFESTSQHSGPIEVTEIESILLSLAAACE